MSLRRSATVFFTVGALAAMVGAPAQADQTPPATSPVAAEVVPLIGAGALSSPALALAPVSAPAHRVCGQGLADGGDTTDCRPPDPPAGRVGCVVFTNGLADGGDRVACVNSE
jgi:hypothetical protein